MDTSSDTTELVHVRAAKFTDLEGIMALLPRLADFVVPAHRKAADLWQGDAKLLQAWGLGQRDDLVVRVAVGESGQVCGVAAASDREDLLTHAPAAHLEVLAIADGMERRGIGCRLLSDIETEMRARGATGMSLHVFSNNVKGRGLYDKVGFDEEIVRCYKPFDA